MTVRTVRPEHATAQRAWRTCDVSPERNSSRRACWRSAGDDRGPCAPGPRPSCAKDIRARRRRGGRRLAMAARRRPARAAGLQGVRADADRARRALASVEQGCRPRHARDRHRQRRSLGRPRGNLPRRPFLRRLAVRRGARSDRRQGGVGRLARRVQAAGRPRADRPRRRFGAPSIRGSGGERRAGHAAVAELSTAVVNPRDEAFLRAKLTPQPIATYMQTLNYRGGLERIAKKTYVRLPDFPNPSFDNAYAACKADPSWSTAELAGCGHYAMFDAPERLAALLLRAA